MLISRIIGESASGEAGEAGHAGKDFRYNLYRSDKPVTQDNLAGAELVIRGITNFSARQCGMNAGSRLKPKLSTSVIVKVTSARPPESR